MCRCHPWVVSGQKHLGGGSWSCQLYTLIRHSLTPALGSKEEEGFAISEPDPCGERRCQFSKNLRSWSLSWLNYGFEYEEKWSWKTWSVESDTSAHNGPGYRWPGTQEWRQASGVVLVCFPGENSKVKILSERWCTPGEAYKKREQSHKKQILLHLLFLISIFLWGLRGEAMLVG